MTSRALHRTTVTRAAKKAANNSGTPIRSVLGLPGKRLSNDTKAKRLRFARANAKWSWDTVMFTGRKKFLLSFPRGSVTDTEWILVGQKSEAFQVNHPSTVNVYAGITKWCATACHAVAGTTSLNGKYMNQRGVASRNITASEYRDVLERTLLPEGTQILATQGVATWVLQQHNDPTHRVAFEVILRWNAQHNSSITLMRDWPPSYPDLSPIETFWSWIQARVLKAGCKKLEQWRAAVEAEVKASPKSLFTAYFNSMQIRTIKTIEADGDKTTY